MVGRKGFEPSACKAGALPIELPGHLLDNFSLLNYEQPVTSGKEIQIYSEEYSSFDLEELTNETEEDNLVLSPDFLYHVSGWDYLSDVTEGQVFTLKVGPQGAEGPGVYFSVGKPRFSAAEGSRGNPVAIVVIPKPTSKTGWWTTKPGIAKNITDLLLGIVRVKT